MADTDPHEDICLSDGCLFHGSHRVGIFTLRAREMAESLLGRTERGPTYNLGGGRVAKGNVVAAFGLLEREHPQVTND